MVGEGSSDRNAAEAASLPTLDCCSCCHIRLSQHPVLWSCLHSYCEKCDSELFAAGSGPVACLVCESPVEPDRRRRDCHVVAAWAAAEAAAQGPSSAISRAACDTCRDESRESEASHRCSGCMRMLCDMCRLWHERFPCADSCLVPIDVDSSTTTAASVSAAASSEWQQLQQRQWQLSVHGSAGRRPQQQRPPCARICPAHLELMDFHCFDCARLKCTTCIKDCMEARHDSVGVSNNRAADRAQAAIRTLKEACSHLDRLEADIAAAFDSLTAEETRLATNHQLALDAVSGVYNQARADVNAAYDQRVDAAQRHDDDADTRASSIDARLRHAVKYGGVLANAADAALAVVTARDENRSGGSSSQPAAIVRFPGAASFAPVDWMLEQRAAMLTHFDALSVEAKRLLGVEDNVMPTENFVDELEDFTLLVCDADIGRLHEAAKSFISCNVGGSLVGGNVVDNSSSSSVGHERDSRASTGRSSVTERLDSVGSRENRATTSLAGGDRSTSSSMAVGPPSLLVERSVSDQASVDRSSDSLTARQASVDRSSDSLTARQVSIERSSDSQTAHSGDFRPPPASSTASPSTNFVAAATSSAAAPTAEPVETQSHTDSGHFEDSPLSTIVIDEITDSFRAVSTCHDVACTNDGHILLAALQHGLKQYEARSGRKRRTWYPAVGERRLRIVSTVDVLDDGRAVVGLIGAQCVAVLRREPPDVWIEECRLDMDAAPYRLAVRGERLAVACADMRDTGKSCGWQPGARLCFGRLPRQDGGSDNSSRGEAAGMGKVPSIALALPSRTLPYAALGVALLDDAVIVSSHERLPVAAEEGISQFVVEAYGDGGSGALLWRYGSTEDVFDLCTIATSSVVYLALPRSLRIMALNGLDGTVLTVVMKEGTHTVVSPNRLAVSFPAADAFPSGWCFLVVLSGNGVVSRYPILRSVTT